MSIIFIVFKQIISLTVPSDARFAYMLGYTAPDGAVGALGPNTTPAVTPVSPDAKSFIVDRRSGSSKCLTIDLHSQLITDQ